MYRGADGNQRKRLRALNVNIQWNVQVEPGVWGPRNRVP